MRRFISMLLVLLMVFSVAAPMVISNPIEASAVESEETGEWVGAWGTGVTDITLKEYDNLVIPAGMCTARIIIKPTISGSKIRLRLSNKYGDTSIQIDRIRIAKSLGEDVIDTKTSKLVTVNGAKKQYAIPAGQELITDPIDFDVVANEPIAVSIHLDEVQNITTAGLSGGSTYLGVFRSDDDTAQKDMGFGAVHLSFKDGFISVVPILAGADVYSEAEDPYSVVVIGDSTVANEFPAYLSRLIQAEACENVGVIGKGIMGNSLKVNGGGLIGNVYGPALLRRMNDDVLGQTNVRYAILKVGANDIIHPKSKNIANYGEHTDQPTAQDLIAGFKNFADICHKNGIKAIVCSITQWKGTTRNYFGRDDEPEYEWDEADWKIAEEVNRWLATTDVFDGYVDLTTITGSYSDPQRFRSDWTSDFIHPNLTAQQVWAEEFPLNLIGVEKAPDKITLSASSIKLNKGKTKTLTYKILPDIAQNADVTWSSSNESVATVDKNGKVKAVDNGKATITCKTYNGEKDTCKVTVVTPSSKVTLNKTSLSLYTTQKVTLKATVSPADTSDKAVKWSSSNTSVAKVNSEGRVTAVGKGTAVITCKAADGGASATCKVTVSKKISVKEITLNKSSKTVYKGDTYQLVATIRPENASNKAITWRSDNSSVASVSSTGKVTAKKNGTAYIMATAADGKLVASCKIKVKTKATGVELSKAEVEAFVGKTTALKAVVSPSGASNKNVTWKSSNTKIATVNSEGVLKGKKTGTVTITVKTKDGGFTDTCTVKVSKYVKTKDVDLNKTSKKMNVGETYTLKATVKPSNASIKDVTWKSSDTSVAKVNSKGKITAVGEGTATITCRTEDGSYKATCKVTVKTVKVKSVKLNESSIRLMSGDWEKLKATVNPSNATDKKVTWKSSDPSVAKVSSTGKITAVSKGTAIITVTTKDGKYKDTCKVTVYGVPADSDQKVMGVKLNKSSMTLKKGDTYRLIATVLPENAGNQKVTWITTDPSVATVSSKGVVTANKAGKVYIRAKTQEGSYIATCTVTVN